MKALWRGTVAGCALALAAQAVAQPVVHATDGVRWVTGGVTGDERGEMIVLLPEYNLKLVNAAERSGAFVADVGLQVLDVRGAKVLATRLDGPWFLAQLPAGRYQLVLTFAGGTQTRSVTIPATGRREDFVYWAVPNVVVEPAAPPPAAGRG